MSTRYKKFSVTGVTNTETLDTTGIQSTVAEPKHLKGLLVNVDDVVGNDVVGIIGQVAHLEIPDYLLDSEDTTGGANTVRSNHKFQFIELGLDMVVGEVFQIGITCGGTASNLRGAYVYEIR